MKLLKRYEGCDKRVPNVMYANKFIVSTKFLEAIQSFVQQYNKLLHSFVYLDPAFFIG